MKNLTMENGWMRYFAYAFIAVTISLLVSACGEDKGGQTHAVVPVNPYINASCIGCPVSTTLISSALGKSWNYANLQQAQLSLQFYADAASYTAAQTMGSRYYQGPVVAGGFLNVLIPKTSSPYCIIPQGLYTISTLAPGQWSGETFSEMRLQAIGPTSLQLVLRRNGITAGMTQIDRQGQSFPYSLMTDVEVISPNGVSCTMGQPEYYFAPCWGQQCMNN